MASSLLYAGMALTGVGLLTGILPHRLLDGEPRALLRSGLVLAGTSSAAGVCAFLVARGVTGFETALASAMTATVLTSILVFDARFMLIPDVCVAALVALALFSALRLPLSSMVGGAALGGLLLWAVREFYWRARGIEALGLGDVKLLGALGALTGPRLILWVLVGGAVIGIMHGALANRLGQGWRNQAVPFGTAVAIPGLLAVAARHVWP